MPLINSWTLLIFYITINEIVAVKHQQEIENETVYRAVGLEKV